MVPRSRSNKSILIADNDEKFVYELRLALEEAGFEVITANDGETVLTSAAIKPALILININLPILDGWRTAALLKNSQATASIPVIFFADEYSESDEVLSFELGGTNYLVKPITPNIIIAIIKNILNERTFFQSNAKSTNVNIKTDEFEIDADHLMVKLKDRAIKLTKRELQLLIVLARNKNRVINRSTIYREIWEKELQRGNRNIDVLILRLRNKLGEKGKHIKTISGVGYKLKSR